jgi:hypothetical protein
MARKVEQDSEPQGGATPKFDRSKDYTPYQKPVDISNRVDPSWKRTDGFAAKLDKGPKEDA